MKLKNLITPFAASLCLFVATNVHALDTNTFAFKASVIAQTSVNDDGTNTTFVSGKASVANADIINALSTDTTNNFSKSAKLVMIDGDFAVLDGGTAVDVSSIMSLSFGTNDIESGKTSDSTFVALPTIKDSELVTLNFDDLSIANGSHIKFSMTGLASSSTSDSKPKNGVVTETFSAKIAGMTGEGTRNGVPFVATGSASASGKLTFVP
jgi:hypothetical protein